MKYIIIACLISLGMASAGMAQDCSDTHASISEKPGTNYNRNYKDQFNSRFDKEQMREGNSCAGSVRNDHPMPVQSLIIIEEMDNGLTKSPEKPDLKNESSSVNPDDHLKMGNSQTVDQGLLKEQRQTEFGKTCSIKRQGQEPSSESFKIKGDNLKAERKPNGEERVKFHNKNENLVYHEKENGKSHYKYAFKDRDTDMKVEKKKSGHGYAVLKSKNIEEDQSALLMEQGALGVTQDINFCLR
jgi:hypothetical protein